MKNIAFTFLALTTFLFASCSSDDATDTEKPTIVLLSPADHAEFEMGSTIQVEALLTDNDALASYKIEIHSAEDGHSHSHARATTNYFQYEETVVLSTNPKVYELQHAVTIPLLQNDEPLTDGHYHLGIFVLDKSGNQAQVFTEIYIGADDEHHHHK
ncbi:DUF4625 domain-containing protein [Flavobacterium agricola]|uniref:DUF4625 domain-containing protein n=1 Tax=Flavobacterium agricola TaxID=2870839 RepID=A0ABY6LY06_9FLAO|nr:DUF4625 domain-containing protein [Flavobacterium agricola]UYW01219.1 DUF4625 domain-containing protein [Flavobacterium agricola]